METVLVNLSGKVHRVTSGGRGYLVAPLSLIVPGVLAGSQGPLYYPPDEVAKDPSAWNGVPLLLNHPAENGAHVSGRHPAVWDKALLGHVFNATVSADGRLVADGWFEADAVRRIDPGLLASLEGGRPVELSTGLFTDNELAPAGSMHNGKPYTHVARRYRPDHVAVLVGQKGACSIADGCGVLVNEAQAKGTFARLMDWAAKALGGSDGVNMAVETAGGDGAALADNWCNQYGGDTCGGGKAAAEKVKAPKIKAAAEKVKAIAAKVDVAKAKLAALQGQLKAAKVDVAKLKADVKKNAGPTKADAAAKDAAGKLKALADKHTEAARAFTGGRGGRLETDPAKRDAAVREALGKASAHKVVKELGMAPRKSVGEAVRAIGNHVFMRGDSLARSEA